MHFIALNRKAYTKALEVMHSLMAGGSAVHCAKTESGPMISQLTIFQLFSTVRKIK